MVVKRIITDDQKIKIKEQKKYKGKKLSQLNQAEKDDLLEIIAKKLNIL